MWEAIERVRTVLQIAVALLTIFGGLALWLRFWVPGWLTVLLIAFGLTAGFALGVWTNKLPKVKVEPTGPIEINRINFKYADEPTKHGWRITYDVGHENAPARFCTTHQEFIGRCASIEASRGARVEYELGPSDRIADGIHVEYKPQDGAFYVRTKVSSALHSTTHHWIQYQIGRSAPKRLGDNEWIVFVQPAPLSGQWLSMRCDLRKHFELTFGQDGLALDHVSGFRIRGKMQIATLVLFTSAQPRT
jgi:hypothetical protein